ncbi:MAG: hypothetical protein ACREBE_04365 [bacterium]
MAGDRVARSKIVEGLVTPAFIHNGTFFFVNVPVSLAEGVRVEICQLGAFTVAQQQWNIDIEDIVRCIPDLIDDANRRPDSVARCRAAFAA